MTIEPTRDEAVIRTIYKALQDIPETPEELGRPRDYAYLAGYLQGKLRSIKREIECCAPAIGEYPLTSPECTGELRCQCEGCEY